MQRRIRLLRLEGGGHGNPEITCELFEVDFHREHGVMPLVQIPQKVQTVVSGDSTISSPTRFAYEALSWCWGIESKEYGIRVKKDGHTFRLQVSRELALALKYLRRTNEDRILWIDAICIDQENHEERNHQVQMMSLIYNSAKQVCVWLGEDNDDSATAISFIREIMQLENFDAIAANKDNATKWQSLLLLMQRPWFSRRWVVQEIALAREATIYCGKDEILWVHFAVAVELFVEVETATHRLSEVMQKTEAFNHVPQWFEHVSELGASVLVQATGKVFRRDTVKATPEPVASGSLAPPEPSRNVQTPVLSQNSDPENRTGQSTPPRPLLGLEYLVSSLSVFEATQPRDAVYSLLAIARDTAPMAELSTVTQTESKEAILMMTVSSFLERKPFRVDYGRPYSDICKDFIAFCIGRAQNTDPIRALDILCRPWAPTPQPYGSSTVVHKKPIPYKALKGDHRKALWRLPSDAKEQKTSKWSDPPPEETKEEKDERISRLPKDCRTIQEYYADSEAAAPKDHKAWLNKINVYLPKSNANLKDANANGTANNSGKAGTIRGENSDEDQDVEKTEEPKDIDLPSWVSRISGAAFALYHHPGMQSMKRMGRKNADPLVGLPLDGHRNYSAAQNTKANLQKLRFRKRPTLGHHSLYVEGFILDKIAKVKEPARLGAIPETWAQLANWDDAVEGQTDPPAEFWRTLVADRGKDNRNPPYYYATACKESVKKGGLRGGSVDTGALIASERNSIIAEFCRRVQAVIWNRCMIRTNNGTLGLANQDVREGDLVCIIFGCSVPVILRRNPKKSEKDLEDEQLEDDVDACRKFLSRVEEACFRKLRYADTKEKKAKDEKELRNKLKGKQDNKLEKEKEANNTEEEGSIEGEQKQAQNLRNVGDLRTKKGAEDVDEQAQTEEVTVESWVETVREETVIINNLMAQWKLRDEEDKHRKRKEEEDSQARKKAGAQREEGRRRRLKMPPMPEVIPSQQSGSTSSEPPTPTPRSMTPQEHDEPDNDVEDKWHSYRLLGEAYIHGMMDGEAIREHIINRLRKRCIEIR
ncbi:heterokaryon incompatibility protein-domain-containing protein [Triangularia setosa]|uniref:Heterokaryon incompatibility protein-domain-containing protein n=1 Tax=Triangularia setosa TaxID=2587417 RepID=A0AAN6VYW0_9PEZI|nr:heterokaryon incompatibility protein-domain-containing protein [Podospora setosa]